MSFKQINFCLNRNCAPHLSLHDFLALVKRLNIDAIELRNDLMNQEINNGMAAKEIKSLLRDENLTLASINALQRCNEWNDEREQQAAELFDYAKRAGAKSVVMCPVVEANHGWNEHVQHEKLVEAMNEVAKIADNNKVIALLEPLGMPDSTLRHQQDAMKVIHAVNSPYLKLCYDSFHYYISNDNERYPSQTAMLHISGLQHKDINRQDYTDPDRGFVFEDDIAQNIAQMKYMLDHGYKGYISFEPFDPRIQYDSQIENTIAKSINYIRERLKTNQLSD